MQQGTLAVVDSMEQAKGKTGDQKVFHMFLTSLSIFFVSCDYLLFYFLCYSEFSLVIEFADTS